MKNLVAFSLFAVISLCVSSTAWAGKAERIGGYKARNVEEKTATNWSDSGKAHQYSSLSTKDQEFLMDAARMAESGYPDGRADSYKETKTGYQPLDTTEMDKIVANSQLKLKVYDQPREIRIDDKPISFGDRPRMQDSEDNKLLTIPMITGDRNAPSYSDDIGERLNARIFKKDDGTVAIVFAGSDSNGDWADNVKQGVPVAPIPQAYKEAAALLDAVKKTYPGCDIEVYGHSQGGGHTSYAILKSGADNPGPDGKTGVVRGYGVNSAGLNGLITVNSLDETTAKKAAQNLVLIQNGKELCSNYTGYQFGTWIHIGQEPPDPPG